MQMIGKDNVGIDLERVTRSDILDGSQQERDCFRFLKQRASLLGNQREEECRPGSADASISHLAAP
jgi:hypothetical protein